MDRSAARALAKSTLEALSLFKAVEKGVPGLFAGRSPVAVITSRSMNLQPLSRALIEIESGITVSIYVRHDSNGAGADEDQLDSLTKASMLALHATGVFSIAESSADPAGGHLRDVDRNNVLYRIERIPLTVLEES